MPKTGIVKATTTKTASPTNTSAPAAAPGTDADVTAKGVEQSTPQANTEATGTQQLESTATPPEGETSAVGLAPVAVTEVVLKAQALRPDDPIVTHLQIRALVDGFRRAGRAWSKQETVVAVEDFTPAQVEALLAEPHLVVLPMVIGMDPGSEV